MDRSLGRVFDEVPDLYDRVRPGYPAEIVAELAALAGLDADTAVLEVGCGTGQATQALAALGCAVTAVEPGAGLAALARDRLAGVPTVATEVATFEDWADRGRRFDALVAAAAWHWVDPGVGWRRAHGVLRPGGAMALLDHVVVRRAGEPEGYALTADLHERAVPGHPGWGHPPLETEALERLPDPFPPALFERSAVRSHPVVQWFDGAGFADHLRSLSLYRGLASDVREPLLDAVAARVRDELGDRVARRYLCVLRVARRAG